MVRRLVRRRLLRALTAAKSAGAKERHAAGFAGRLVAASYKGDAHGGAFQHSAGVSIRGLRIPDCALREYLRMQGRCACSTPKISRVTFVRALRGCKKEIWFHVRIKACGTAHRLCA